VTDWHPLLQLLVAALAAARVTMLLVTDAIGDGPRLAVHGWLIRRGHFTLYQLASCMQCLGFWVSFAWVLAWGAWPETTTIVALPWAVAMAAWWFGGAWLPEDDDDDDDDDDD
jgi:hypothetical protein